MPMSPCCKRKYSKPCKCNTITPRNNCECVIQTGQCPPPQSTTEEEEEEGPVLYAPVIAAAPVSKKCTCCGVKPKKSLWQQLFGDRKCCSPCQKKKQDCFCKQKKRQKCVPECTNSICCNDSKPRSLAACKPCRPLCCCKVKTCNCKTRCKPCCPTPTSICGCHFYCNVENRPKLARCCCCSPTRKSGQRRIGTEATTEEERILNSYSYKSGSKDNLSAKPSPNDSRKKPQFSDTGGRSALNEPTQSNIHIGLTFTNTETKYYHKNSPLCPPVKIDSSCNSTESEGRNESSEKIITLEIHHSDRKMAYDENETEENGRSRDDETSSINYSSKRRRLSAVREENENQYPRSESFSREIIPLVERRSKVGIVTQGTLIDDIPSDGSAQRKREKRLATDYSLKSKSKELDRRVSEILSRLRTIENKINVIDNNGPETKTFNVSTGDYKDPKHGSFEKNTYSNSKYSRKADAVIEIRKTRSKSCSPVRRHTSSEYSRYSRSLDRGTRVQSENPKVVIKFPNGNHISQGIVSVSNNNRIRHLNKDYQDSEWADISKELKNRKLANTPCYCYECVCKRIKCSR